MTRFECIKTALKMTAKGLRGLAQLWVCYGLFRICEKLNPKAELTTLRRGFNKAGEDCMDALKRIGANEQYEEFKRLWDEYEL